MAYHRFDTGDPIFVADGDGSNPRQILRDSADKGAMVTEAEVKPYLAGSRRAVAPRIRGNALYYLSETGGTVQLWRREGGGITVKWAWCAR
jgi:hypothetical protein